jgi:hypothetical protein
MKSGTSSGNDCYLDEIGDLLFDNLLFQQVAALGRNDGPTCYEKGIPGPSPE